YGLIDRSSASTDPCPLSLHDALPIFIGRLVREFYGRVRRNDRLGPIFAAHIGEIWEPHLEKMTDFWCSVILKDGSYSGRPVPARSEEHTSELQSREKLVCRLLLEKKI